MAQFAPTSIDVTRLAAPLAIEALDFELLQSAFIDRFQAEWDAQRVANPDLPEWNVSPLELDPSVIASQAWSYLRLLDRQRVNDVAKALTAAFAKGTDLDHFVARNNVTRLELIPASGDQPAVMESDDRLLQRYLLSFSGRSAGSRERYIFEALTAVPALPAGGVAVLGHAVHGRRGDVEIVICGPGGRDVTDEELAAVQAACLADHVVPVATHAQVTRAERHEYTVAGTLVIPPGPSPETVRAEAIARIREEADRRTLIGAKVVRDFLAGAANGLSVIDSTLALPEADIEADPYTVPVCTDIAVTIQVAS